MPIEYSPSERQSLMDAGRTHWHGGQAVGRSPQVHIPSGEVLTDTEREQLLWDEELRARTELNQRYEDPDDE